jgi:small subunit ribosomal protein S8
MSMTDPIADLLTRIRNGLQARHDAVVVPRSKLKLEITKILKNEGFIEGYLDLPSEGPAGAIKLFLKYDGSRQGVIQGLQRVSTPSRRFYVGKDEIPRVRNGLGLAILTTPQGVLSDRAARTAGVGGEVICYVW